MTPPAPPVALIAAVARNGVIGADNALPWRLPEDMQHFRALTIGHAVIMGRRTWNSLPRALPARQNIVVTRTPGTVFDGAQAAGSFEEALALVALPAPAFCIGGGELYALALPHADVAYLTEIDADVAGDTRFPALDRDVWREAARESRQSAAGLAFAFVTYQRARAPADS